MNKVNNTDIITYSAMYILMFVTSCLLKYIKEKVCPNEVPKTKDKISKISE